MLEKLFQCRRNQNIKHIVFGEVSSPCNRLRRHTIVNWFCYVNFFDPMYRDVRKRWFCTYFSFWFLFFFSVDLPALKFQWVREFSQMHFRDWKSRVIHHTIVRISSSSVIQWVQGCDSLIKTWRWYWRTLRLSSLPSSMFHNISWITRSQSARRWCQIPWILEESWGWSFSSR